MAAKISQPASSLFLGSGEGENLVSQQLLSARTPSDESDANNLQGMHITVPYVGVFVMLY